MTDPTIPKMPEPAMRFTCDTTAIVGGKVHQYAKGDALYTADQLRAYADACVAQERGQAMSEDSLLAAVMAFTSAGKNGANLFGAITAAIAAAIRKGPTPDTKGTA